MTGEHMLYAIALANVAVFAAWHNLDPRFMRANFLVSEESIKRGRWHTLLTSAFSHRDVSHLAANMLALYFFGRDVARALGPAALLNLYVVAGVVASGAHVAWCEYKRAERAPKERGIFQSAGRYWENNVGYLTTPPALGASGAVNAIVLLNALLWPGSTVYLYMVLPVPNAVLAAAFVARDYYGARLGLGESGVGHAAHLGGAAVGAAAWGGLMLKRMARR